MLSSYRGKKEGREGGKKEGRKDGWKEGGEEGRKDGRGWHLLCVYYAPRNVLRNFTCINLQNPDVTVMCYYYLQFIDEERSH